MSMLILHTAATTVMLGVIWYVQLIRYPSFRLIPEHKFTEYHRRYTKRIGFVVGPAMTMELMTGIALLMLTSGSCFMFIAAGMFMLVLIWISTACVQVPCHNALSQGFHTITHRRLVATNWVRTVFWSIRWPLVASALVTANHT